MTSFMANSIFVISNDLSFGNFDFTCPNKALIRKWEWHFCRFLPKQKVIEKFPNGSFVANHKKLLCGCLVHPLLSLPPNIFMLTEVPPRKRGCVQCG